MPDVLSRGTVFDATSAPLEQIRADMIFVPMFQDEDLSGDLEAIDAATGGEIGRARTSGEFRAKTYECLLTHVVDPRWKAARVAVVGVGASRDADIERLRRVAASAGYTATLRSIQSVAYVARGRFDALVLAQTAADGLSAAEFDS